MYPWTQPRSPTNYPTHKHGPVQTAWGCFLPLQFAIGNGENCSIVRSFPHAHIDTLYDRTLPGTSRAIPGAPLCHAPPCTFLLVLQKMTAWVMVRVSYRSHSVSNFHSSRSTATKNCLMPCEVRGVGSRTGEKGEIPPPDTASADSVLHAP